jgi:hypothetical protein
MSDATSRLEAQLLATLDRWKLADDPLAAGALDIVERLKEPKLRPAAAAMLHAQLRPYLADLQKLAPEEAEADEINEIEERREKRRGGAGLG